MAGELSFDRAAAAEPMDARVTITLLVTSIVLSGMRLQGSDFDFLVPSWRTMPDEWWRLFSASLLHGGWLHLVFNVLWLFRFGVVLEAMLGTVAFSAVVVLLAGGPMAAQWAFGGPAVGLSGLLYGFFGLLWALDRWHPRCRGVLARRVTELLAAWFLLCILLGWYDIWPIANVAHGAGALIGGLLGWGLAESGRRALARHGVLAFAVVTIALLATLLRPTVNRSDYYAIEAFERGLQAIEANDLRAAQVYFRAVISRTDDPGAWNNLGVAHLRLGELEEAEAAFARKQEILRETGGEGE